MVQNKLDRTCGAEPLPVQEFHMTPTDPDQSEEGWVEDRLCLDVTMLTKMEWQVSWRPRARCLRFFCDGEHLLPGLPAVSQCGLQVTQQPIHLPIPLLVLFLCVFGVHASSESSPAIFLVLEPAFFETQCMGHLRPANAVLGYPTLYYRDDGASPFTYQMVQLYNCGRKCSVFLASFYKWTPALVT